MHNPAREQLRQGLALFVLLLLAGFAIAGPTGLLAWSENAQTLEQRKAHLAKLKAEHEALQNRVALLAPSAADPDLASELVRKKLGVIHADEVMITFEEQPE